MGGATHIVGIDLGTTHCAVASSVTERADVRVFDVPQLLAPGEIAARPLLPSFLYLPAPGELAPEDLRLPWGPADAVVGELARRRGAQVPNRLVSSAKSWICHGGVNRRAPILPWSAPDGEPKVSPFEASVRYLGHLRQAWDGAHPSAPLREQEVVVTVPASFDEVARELTSAAAREAGLPEVRLLEEPQAAFYDFLGEHAEASREALRSARLVLVVDVGGGTTDLTLLKVLPAEGDDDEPVLERIAVGGHLMLGGDNMDAALAHHVLERTGVEARQLDPTEWAALVQSARQAKERLLAEDAPDELTVTLQRRGARLLGGTRSVALSRDAVRALLVDGFVPRTRPDEVANREGRAGLTTLGLPYTSDPAIPRHVATFLRRHVEAAREAGAEIQGGLPRPDLLLLNGGVFHAPALTERLSEVLAGWYGAPVPLLPHTSLDTAVARGAVRFGLARRGVGRVIGGGAARAYYVGVAGEDGRPQALCVAPKGMEEGTAVEVRDRTFHLVVNQPVAFPLYAYTGDRNDAVGQVIDVDTGAGDELDPLPALETVLKQKGDLWVDKTTGGVPVRLEARLTEGGTLELSLATVELPPRRWRLELGLGAAPAAPERPQEPSGGPEGAPPVREEGAPEEPLPKAFGDARRALERPFGAGKYAGSPEAAKQLRAELEGALGPRGEWSTTVCRALFDLLMGYLDRRGRSPQHELAWLRLVSWCARPGFGAKGDRGRIDQLWALHELGLKNIDDKSVWAEWWILWRRVAPGLDRARQQALFEEVKPWLAGGKPPKGPRAHAPAEMLRMLAALERLPPDAKESAALWLRQHSKKVGSYWPLGRLGAREPFHGDPRDVVPPAVAEAWLDELLALDWKTADGAAFAAVLLARVTGDPARDLPEKRRKQVIGRLRDIDAPTPWVEMLTKATAMSEGDARRTFGDSLPPGLRLA